MAEQVLTLRELNRATLARQMLLERASLTSLEMMTRLVGMQGQVANAPYIGLWTRLCSFQRDELTRLLADRQVVKASLMRSTLHLMTAEDYLLFRPALQPAMSQKLRPFFAEGRVDEAEFTKMVRAYVLEQPRSAVELRAKFGTFFPGVTSGYMSDALRAQVSMIAPFPNGQWGFTGRPTFTEAATWLGQPLTAPEVGIRPLVVRYLAAFGPASVRDMQEWSGLTKLQGVFEELRPELVTFRDERGRELFDLPDAPRPPADTVAPPRFLPEYDNLLLAYADRRRVVDDAHRMAVFLLQSKHVQGPFLVDGMARGLWRVERRPEGTTEAKLVIEPFADLAPLADEEYQALVAEGEPLVRFVEQG